MAISKRDILKVRKGDVLLHFTGRPGAPQFEIKAYHVLEVLYEKGDIAGFMTGLGGGKRPKKERVSARWARENMRRFAPEWLPKGEGKARSYECYHCGATVESKAAVKALEKGAGHGETCNHPRARRYRKKHAQLRLFG